MKICELEEILRGKKAEVYKTGGYKKAVENGIEIEYLAWGIFLDARKLQEDRGLRLLPKETDFTTLRYIEKILEKYGLSKRRVGYQYIRHAIVLAVVKEVEGIDAVKLTARDYGVPYNKAFRDKMSKALIAARTKVPEEWKETGNNYVFTSEFIDKVAFKIAFKEKLRKKIVQ